MPLNDAGFSNASPTESVPGEPYEPPVLAEAVSLAGATLQAFSGAPQGLDAGFVDFGGF